MDVRGNGCLVKNTRSSGDHPEVCGSQRYSCIFTGSLCFTRQLCIVLHCWSFMYRVLGSLEWFGLTSRAVCSQVRKERAFPVYIVRIILHLVGLAFQDYKDFFILLPPCLCLPFRFFFRMIDILSSLRRNLFYFGTVICDAFDSFHSVCRRILVSRILEISNVTKQRSGASFQEKEVRPR